MLDQNCEKDIEDVHTWALEHMEGCDEPEWTMFDKIASAIENYWLKKFKNQMDDAVRDTIARMPNVMKMLEDS